MPPLKLLIFKNINTLKYNILTSLAFVLSFQISVAQSLFSVLDFGAKADGKTISTLAIQKALDATSAAGGTLVFPKGTYLTGTIFIKSNTQIELSAGATILGSTNLKDYTKLTWGHHEDRTPWHLIVADKAQNIRIFGQGAINGNGPAFWQKERKHVWAFYTEIEERPSPMVEITNCENVIIENISLLNPAGWTLHPFNSKNIKIKGITIKTNLFGPNSDGIDVGGCQDVLISDCNISSGDDAIALKTTEDSGPCERVTISNCILETNCVALRIGFESRQDIRDITATNLVVKNASRIIDIRSVEGAVIERVNISNIVGQTNSGWPVNRVVEIDLNEVPNVYDIQISEHPNYKKDKPLLKKGAIRDIQISNLNILTDGRIMVGASAGNKLENISFSNILLRFAMLDNCLAMCKKAEGNGGFFKGSPELRAAPAAVAVQNVNGFYLTDFQVSWPTYPVPADWNLLKTEWRFLEPDWYKGNEEKIRSGEMKPVFKAFWGKNIVGGKVDLSRVKSSDSVSEKAEWLGSKLD